jgi:HSP20 family protein
MTVQITASNRNFEGQRPRNFPTSPFRMFEDFFNDWAVRSLQAEHRDDTWVPPVDVIEREGNLLLRVEVPGISEKDIDLNIDGSVLTIRGEKKQAEPKESGTTHQSEIAYGLFTRSFTLPDTVETDKISAVFKNGVLTITLPGKPETRPRTIKINA